MQQKCPHCGGEFAETVLSEKPEPCETCGDSKRIPDPDKASDYLRTGMLTPEIPCPICQPEPPKAEAKCKKCRGRGWYLGKFSDNFMIPCDKCKDAEPLKPKLP